MPVEILGDSDDGYKHDDDSSTSQLEVKKPTMKYKESRVELPLMAQANHRYYQSDMCGRMYVLLVLLSVT